MKKLRIYVVDDDADDLENLSDAIESIGCASTVYFSQNMAGLFLHLKDESLPCPDLIVLDHQTPGTKGDEAVQLLRNDPRYNKTAIVVYSTHVTATSQEDLKNKGADLCFAKGVTMDEIRNHVLAFCAAAEKRSQPDF